MSRPRSARRWRPAASAVAFSALALFVRFALDPILGEHLPYVTFFVAVALTAYLGNVTATVLAIFIGYVAASWFFGVMRQTLYPHSLPDLVGTISYFVVCGVIAAMSHLISLAKTRALASRAELASRQKQLENEIAERRRAEASLAESEARYRSLLELAPDAILVHQDRKVVYANAASLELCGAGVPEQLLGTDVIELVHLEDRESLMRRAELAATGARTPPREFRLLRLDGTEVIAEACGVRIQYGGHPAVQVIIRDITERIRSQLALREDQALLRAIIDTIADSVYVKDTESRLILANPAVLDAVGKPAEQVIGHTDREFYDDPAVGEAILQHDRRVMESGTVQVFEETIQTPDGYRIVLNTKAPRRDASGRIVGLVGTGRDITERKRTEEAVRESERLYRAIGESIDYGVWVCDPYGRNVYTSPSFLNLVGLTQDQCSSFGWGSVLHPEDAEYTMAAWKECVRTGGTWDIEHRYRGLDGRWHPILARGVPVRNEAGEITGWAGINLDISRLKETEAALRDADRRKDEFLAVLSHELRNPLAAIRNGLYVLEHTASGGERAQRAQAVIGRQVTHLARLIDDLLDVTRIARGKIQLRRERLDLPALILRTVEDHRAALASSEIELELLLPSEPMQILADATRIAQVVGNLLENARKFTPRGGSVVVSLRQDGSDAVVSVRDTGEGIASDLLPRLFEPFMQGTQTLDRSRGGLGLGLALSKGLVDQHGGTMSALSEGIGRGAEFTVRLPITPIPERTVVAAPSAPVVRGRRVLIIEDNPDAAESLREALELGGHDVAIARDGHEGVRIAHDLVPEVVLCDIGLPGMDGYAVARALRTDAKLAGCLLVALTGYALPEDIAKATAAGFHQHLAKPPSMEQVEQLLAERASQSG